MENFTKNGHLNGMLDRDQRTAKVRYFNSSLVSSSPAIRLCYIGANNQNIVSHHCNSSSSGVPGKSSPSTSWRSKSRRNSQLWKSLLRLKHALIVGAYLSLLTFPSISTAPTNKNTMSDRTGEPQWFNPCGKPNDSNSEGGEPYTTLDLNPIINQASAAHALADMFKEDFAQEYLRSDWTKWLNKWQQSSYSSWLPHIPKNLGDATPLEHLESLELDKALVDTYKHLQTLAVGLEQIVWDMEDLPKNDMHNKRTRFLSNFQNLERSLCVMLCEILSIIIERDVRDQMHENVPRSVMPESLKNLDFGRTAQRDAMIYRDYMNALEYIRDVFSHLKEKQNQ